SPFVCTGATMTSIETPSRVTDSAVAPGGRGDSSAGDAGALATRGAGCGTGCETVFAPVPQPAEHNQPNPITIRRWRSPVNRPGPERVAPLRARAGKASRVKAV